VSDVCHPERSAAGHPERSATGHPERSAAGHPERSGGSLSSGREILRRFTPQDDTSGRFTALDDDARDRKKSLRQLFQFHILRRDHRWHFSCALASISNRQNAPLADRDSRLIRRRRPN
jgi:hypothetical protein